MKKNIPFNNQIIHILLLFILMIYIFSDILVKNWDALIVMAVVGILTYYLDGRKNIILMMMILLGCVYRSFFEIKEGMTKRKKEKEKKENPLSNVEGMLDNTMKQHKQLMDMATQLQPMMNNASKLLKGLPEGFLDKALANLKNK
jgi:hypothetical protein